MEYYRAAPPDFEAILEMALLLLPDEPEELMRKELQEVLASAGQAVFACRDDAGRYAGFIHLSTRREYVPGATAFPIGYIEEIYVRPAYRREGVAARLVALGEKWASEKGCRQLASDTWLWNTASQEFHKKAGFMEEDRLVFYIKRIDTSG